MQKKRIESVEDKILGNSVTYQQAGANALKIELDLLPDVKIIEDHISISPITTIPCYRIIPEGIQHQFTMFYIPGTAFAKHHPRQNAIVCAHLAQTLSCKIINIHHRLYESNKYPIPYNDCIDVINYYLDNASKYEIDRSKIALSGYSAGGLIALQISLATLRTGQRQLPFQQLILFAPIVDLRENKPDHVYNPSEITASRSYRDQCRSALIPAMLDAGSPAFSPMNCQSYAFESFPKTVIIYGERDSYATDIELFCTKFLSLSRNPSKFFSIPQYNHYFHWQKAPFEYMKSNILDLIRLFNNDCEQQNHVTKLKKFVTAAEIKMTVFNHVRQSSSYNHVTLFEDRQYIIAQHYVQPIVKPHSNEQQSNQVNCVEQLIDPEFYNKFPRIFIKGQLNQQRIFIHWLCQHALSPRAPTFIFLPLSDLINRSFVCELSKDELIEYFYNEIKFKEMSYGYETNCDIVYVLSGLSALQRNDTFNSIKLALQQFLSEKVIFLDQDEPLFEQDMQLTRFYIDQFYILPRSVVQQVRDSGDDDSDDHRDFTRLIQLRLLNPTNGATGVGAHQSLTPERNSIHLMPRFLSSLSRNFSTDIINPTDVNRARILVGVITDLLHYFSSFQQNNPIIFELLLKCINFHLQVDCLSIHHDLLSYSEFLARENRGNISQHHLVAQHYQTKVRFANARRAEPDEYKDLIKAIVEFIHHTVTGHFPDLHQSLAIAYMQAGDNEGCVAELTKLAKTPHVTQSPKKQLTVYANLSTAYMIMKRYASAITYLMMVLRVHNTSTKDPNIGFAYNNLGAIYYELEQFRKSAMFYRQSVLESQYYQSRSQYHRFAGWGYFGLARISCLFNHNRLAAEKQRDEFVTNIREIFPNAWPKSYLDCLQKINGSITSLSLPQNISVSAEQEEETDLRQVTIQAKL